MLTGYQVAENALTYRLIDIRIVQPYSLDYDGFDRVNPSKSSFITTENHHAGETFMLAPLLFSLNSFSSNLNQI